MSSVVGYQSPPVNWGLNTEQKRAFFELLGEVTGSPNPTQLKELPPNCIAAWQSNCMHSLEARRGGMFGIETARLRLLLGMLSQLMLCESLLHARQCLRHSHLCVVSILFPFFKCCHFLLECLHFSLQCFNVIVHSFPYRLFCVPSSRRF